MNLKRFLIMSVLCAASASALAQWQWMDKDGRKVFSDRPPPADVPAKSILKTPVGAAARMIAPDAAPPVAATATLAASAPASAPRIAGKDKELEEKKKKAEDAEAAKKKEETDRVAKIRADNCTRAKASKQQYDSGVRIARVNAKGEREMIDDATRMVESKRLQGLIDSECAPLPAASAPKL